MRLKRHGAWRGSFVVKSPENRWEVAAIPTGGNN